MNETDDTTLLTDVDGNEYTVAEHNALFDLHPCDNCGVLVTDEEYEQSHAFGPCPEIES